MAISSYTELASRSSNANGQTSWAPSLTGIPSNALAMLVFDNSGGTAQPTSVSDGTNSWTNLTGANDSRGSLNWVSIWYFYYASAPGTITLTVSFASSNETFGSVGYFTGTSATPEDVSGSAGGGVSATPSATTSATRTADNELLVWISGCSGGSGTPAITVPTGFTEFHTGGFNDAVRVRAANFGYQVVTGGSGSTATGTGSIDSSRTWSCGIATFKPAAGGGTVAITPATISATSTMSGSVARTFGVAQAATINATASMSATLNAVRAIAGTITASSTFSGGFIQTKAIGSGTINATSVVSGAVSGGSGGVTTIDNESARGWTNYYYY